MGTSGSTEGAGGAGETFKVKNTDKTLSTKQIDTSKVNARSAEILKINNKQIKGEIVKVSIFKAINENMLQVKKKMKEWLKFIFFDLLIIINYTNKTML